jgi:hypothetical protein
MLTCKEVSKLVSESLEQGVPWRKRIGMQIHLMMCEYCSRFKRQMLFLRRLSRLMPEDPAEGTPDAPHLSDEARRRIKDMLSKSQPES